MAMSSRGGPNFSSSFHFDFILASQRADMVTRYFGCVLLCFPSAILSVLSTLAYLCAVQGDASSDYRTGEQCYIGLYFNAVAGNGRPEGWGWVDGTVMGLTGHGK